MADITAETGGVAERYHFLLRRLHSLSGIIPVGVFLCVHLSLNATFMAGPDAFQFAVDQLHKLDHLGILVPVELMFIFIPIVFHALVGVLIWLTSKPNVLAYQYGGNVRYTLQRWSGIIAILFILGHLWHVHWIIPSATDFDATRAAESAVEAMSRWWAGPAYAIGVLCAVFHFANGIWTFLITWGITIGPDSQRRSGYVCTVIGLVLGLFGLGSLVAFKNTDLEPPNPPEVMESHTADVSNTTDLLL
ncbi:MAG: succinate dehydrogenase [Phycisphaerae bacterium]|nr:succinate dehydrogenase [Phycisphaerae bacterium]